MPLTQVQGGMILPSTTLTTPIVATTMGVGGATPSTSGSGITFPAIKSPSSDANTLDDYEEGTWTPTLTNFTINSGTFTGVGTYTKVGNLVTVRMRQTGGTISWTGANSYINGLPFVPDVNLSGAGSYTNGQPNIQGSVLLYRTGGGVGQIWMSSGQSSQLDLVITGTYFV